MSAGERPYTQEMVMIHRVFRREFGQLPGLIRQVQRGDGVRVALLADAIDDLLTGLHVHHSGEDALLWPKLLIRADLDGTLIARMQLQHEQAAVRLESAQKLLGEWRNTGQPETGDRLADELADLAAELDQHLTDEETHILPLVAEHITVEEWAALGEHGLATLGKKKHLIGHLGTHGLGAHHASLWYALRGYDDTGTHLAPVAFRPPMALTGRQVHGQAIKKPGPGIGNLASDLHLSCGPKVAE